MRVLADLSLRRGVAVLLTALCLLIGGIWVGTKVTTDYLLYKDATSTARNWARLLAYITGLVNQRLLLQCEYSAAENRILRSHLLSRLRLSDPQRSTLACRQNTIGSVEGELRSSWRR